ncbi:hypothetical protein THAOC_16201, partial [Thalassiosira oceanica]
MYIRYIVAFALAFRHSRFHRGSRHWSGGIRMQTRAKQGKCANTVPGEKLESAGLPLAYGPTKLHIQSREEAKSSLKQTSSCRLAMTSPPPYRYPRSAPCGIRREIHCRRLRVRSRSPT